MLERRFCLKLMKEVNETPIGAFALRKMQEFHALKPDVRTIEAIRENVQSFHYDTIESWFNDIERYYETFATQISPESNIGRVLMSILQMYKDQVSHRYSMKGQPERWSETKAFVDQALTLCPNSVVGLSVTPTGPRASSTLSNRPQRPVIPASDLADLHRALTSIDDYETRERVTHIMRLCESRTKPAKGQITFNLSELSPYTVKLLMNVVNARDKRRRNG